MQDPYSPLLAPGTEKTAVTYWNGGHSITETSFSTMAKDTRVTFDNSSPNPSKQSGRGRHSRAERQISYEETENCVNEMSESFPGLSNRAHRLMRQVSESFNFRTIKVALITSAILNLLLGIPFGVFFGIWISQKNEGASSSSSPSSSPSSSSSSSSSSSLVPVDNGWQNNQDLGHALIPVHGCYPCSDITSRGLKNRVKVKSRNDICCTEVKIPEMDGASFTFSYANTMRGGDSDKQGFPCRGSGRGDLGYPIEATAAAHMMLDVKQTKLNIKGHGHSEEYPLSWISDDPEGGLNFVGEGVYYSKGQITIRSSGKYHVYSQVTLSTTENPLDEGDAEKIIVHAIIAKSKGTPKTLVLSQVTIKQNEVRSTNMEGTFNFSKGDVISIYVSHPSFLKDVRPGNTFGLFKL
ncbi:uncharacterized protein LOC101857902 isoform X2 [Aplysia californica]|uniref:Uncharacterized protein LOC101857902 isoform X2 n=1 Tax=Aplysia californica TaxID=6500 RepID=A0ABM1A9H1_APLCA|nr:uncharacterized protein LOC101857902 isoform X2 [Aplysia californica]